MLMGSGATPAMVGVPETVPLLEMLRPLTVGDPEKVNV
jgi:hypothetical protein